MIGVQALASLVRGRNSRTRSSAMSSWRGSVAAACSYRGCRSARRPSRARFGCSRRDRCRRLCTPSSIEHAHDADPTALPTEPSAARDIAGDAPEMPFCSSSDCNVLRVVLAVIDVVERAIDDIADLVDLALARIRRDAAERAPRALPTRRSCRRRSPRPQRRKPGRRSSSACSAAR